MNFSVIVPCYNCVRTLENTVNSIRASGLSNYELLLIDDGSTDGTGALCDVLCEKYPELRCIHQPNAGVSAARNRGVDEARGDYLWFVDSDDTVDPGLLTHAVSVAAQQQPDMLIFGMSFDYYYRGKIYRREKLTPPCEEMLTPEQLKEQFEEFYDCNALTTACNKLYRRELVVSSGVRFHEDMILMEDFLFVLELLPFCRSIYSLPEAIYRYRQAEDEKGAYRRLQRIDDLSEYMRPFEKSMETLGIGSAEAEKTYKMLFLQKNYYEPISKIRKELHRHYKSRYAHLDVGIDAFSIYLCNKKIQLRHKIAVRIKAFLAGKKQGTEK
jgi:glycosyltransferase involved in cell wall biosynthesis